MDRIKNYLKLIFALTILSIIFILPSSSIAQAPQNQESMNKFVQTTQQVNELSNLTNKINSGNASDAEIAKAAELRQSLGVTEKGYDCSIRKNLLGCIARGIYDGVLTPISWLLYATGSVFDLVVDQTIVKMKDGIEKLSAINIAWSIIRDLANIIFIFVLLYAGIAEILQLTGHDSKKTLVKVIIAALLINFSLFFTKVVIDISNIAALTFRNQIVKEQRSGNISLSVMHSLGLSSFYDATASTLRPASGASQLDKLTNEDKYGQILTAGVMGGLLMIITAFVFLAMCVMLVVRFVALVFVMILSPIMFVGSVLPTLRDKIGGKWQDTLIGQAIFAPLFFLLLWVTFSILRGINTIVGGPVGQFDATQGAGSLTSVGSFFFNYLIVIAFLITTLVVSKQFATQGSEVLGKAIGTGNKWVGGALFGGSAMLGRQTLGRAGMAVSESKWAKSWAASKVPLIGGLAGRAFQKGATKVATGSMDFRGSGLGKNITDSVTGSFGDTGGKGGYKKGFEDRAKAKVEYSQKVLAEQSRGEQERKEEAQQLGAIYAQRRIQDYETAKSTLDTTKNTAISNDSEVQRLEATINAHNNGTYVLTTAQLDTAKKDLEDRKKAIESTYKTQFDAIEDALKTDLDAVEGYDKEKHEQSIKNLATLAKNLQNEGLYKKESDPAKTNMADLRIRSNDLKDKVKQANDAAKDRQRSYSRALSGSWFNFLTPENKVAGRKIRSELNKGKDEKEKEEVMKLLRQAAQGPQTPPAPKGGGTP